MSRFLAREMAFKVLFQLDFNYENVEDKELFEKIAIDTVISNEEEELETEIAPNIISYFEQIFKGTRINQDEIDKIISAHLKKGWSIQRLATVDRNILRLSVYEIKFAEKVIPKGIVINEAVEIAKKYGTDASGRFVNGILAAIAN